MKTSRTGPVGETIDTPRHRALATASRVAILKIVRGTDGGMNTAEVAERTGLHLSTARAHLDRLVEAGLLVKARASGGQPGRPAWRYRATADETPAPAPYRSLAAALLEHLGGADGDVRAVAGRIGRTWGRHLAAATERSDDPVKAVLTVLSGLGFNPRLAEPGTTAPGAAGTGAAEAGAAGTSTTEPSATTAGATTASETTASTTTTGAAGQPVAAVQPVAAAQAGTPEQPIAAEVHLHTCPFLELVGRNPDAMCGLHVGVIRGVMEYAGAPNGNAVLEPFGAPTACVVRLSLGETEQAEQPEQPGQGAA